MKTKMAVSLASAAFAVAAGTAMAAPTAIVQPTPIERAVTLCTTEVGDAQICEGMIYSGTPEGSAWLAKGAAQFVAKNAGYRTEKNAVRRAVTLCTAHVGDAQTCEGIVLSDTKQGTFWLARAYSETLANAPVFKTENDPVRRAVVMCAAHVGDMQTCEGIVLSDLDSAWLETAKRR